MSALANTPEFRAFTRHWLLHATTFAAAYNDTLAAHRARYGLRGARRPATDLEIGADRVECPFWLERNGKRSRLFVQRDGDMLRIFAGLDPLEVADIGPFASWSACDRPLECESAGWLITPRALMLSAFSRLFLADLFLHGIGGARYDEVTEDIATRIFGISLPPIACVTATLYVSPPGLERAATPRTMRVTRRDLRYNPQRVLAGVPEALLRRRAELIERSDSLGGRAERALRRQTYEEIRDVIRQIRESAAGELAKLESRWSEIAVQQRRDEILQDREYYFALHPRRELQSLVQRLQAELGIN